MHERTKLSIRRTDPEPLCFCGQVVSSADLELIVQIVDQYDSLSRTELANTVCELLAWQRPTGKLKTVECRQFLESLHEHELIQLPNTQHRGRGKSHKITLSERSAEGELLQGTLRDFRPVSLKQVRTPEQRRLFRELIERYHYLGYRSPFGAHLCYLIEIARPRPMVGQVVYNYPPQPGAWRHVIAGLVGRTRCALASYSALSATLGFSLSPRRGSNS